MKSVICKKCECIIFHEYTPLEGKSNKYLSKLEQKQTDNCNTSIYLSCVNGHLDRYFCEIKLI